MCSLRYWADFNFIKSGGAVKLMIRHFQVVASQFFRTKRFEIPDFSGFQTVEFDYLYFYAVIPEERFEFDKTLCGLKRLIIPFLSLKNQIIY